MNCPCCKADIPENSKYCDCCGARIAGTKVSVASVKSSKESNKGTIVVLVLLIVLLLGLNGVQYYLSQNVPTKSSELIQVQAENAELQRTVDEKDAELLRLQGTIDSQKVELQTSSQKASYFDIILKAVKGDNIGRGSSHFYVNSPVVQIKKGSTKTVTLTTSWSGEGTVSCDNSAPLVSSLSFNKDEWDTSCSLTVKGINVGVSVYSFSNTANSKTFKMIVIVTES